MCTSAYIILLCLVLYFHPTLGVIKIKMGFLAPWTNSDLLNDFSGATSAGAINIAIDAIKEMDMVEELEFEVVTRDSSCNSKQASGYAVDLHIQERVDVIIGPPCSSACMMVGQLASFWNIPIISWVATAPELNDKNVYSTLGRTLGPFTKLGVVLNEIMESYDWTRVVVIYSTFISYLDAGKAILKTFGEKNVTIGYQVAYGINPTKKKVQNILRKTIREGRIVVISAPKRDRRMILLEAFDMGMTKGDYVFYTVEMLPDEDVITAEETYLGNDRNEDARQAFEAVFHMSLAALSNENIDTFTVEVASRLKRPPWNLSLQDGVKGNKYSAFLYDALILYAIAINQTMSLNYNYKDGEVVLKQMKNKFFKGMTGNVLLDEYGDREPDFWITDLQPNGIFEKMSEVVNLDDGTRIFRQLREPRWPDGRVGHQYAPRDAPLCGFRGELCDGDKDALIYIAAFVAGGVVIVAVSILSVWLYRRSKYESELLNLRWKMQMEEVQYVTSSSQRLKASGTTGSHSSLPSNQSVTGLSKHSSNSARSMDGKSSAPSSRTVQYYNRTAMYRGVLVALKKINKEHLQMNRSVLVEFSEIRLLTHENLNTFIGACVETGSIYLAWQYCTKGSLQDVLQNDDVRLDRSFKMSFMTDIVKGMEYLHKSSHGIGSHGALKSSNCLVDGRWVVKITDYGLASIVQGQVTNETDEQEKFMRKLWTAPEILRLNFPPKSGTQKGDVFSYAIIMFEIVERSAPYIFDHITPRDAVNRIRNGESTPYRPVLQMSLDDRAIITLMQKCWAEDPDARPTFPRIRAELRKINGKEINIMDNILSMMEKYANNLEEIVDQRTEEVLEEKRKTDRLLHRMLPLTVAEQLKSGRKVDPENYDSATIYFSDIVGFATLTSESTPIQIVAFLNGLYRCFDDIIGNHDVYKVETISDAYMIVSGLPQRNGNRHAPEIANCALDLLSSVVEFKIPHRPKQKLQLRIGIHTGPVVAAVVGLVMPRYCLFGDTVNMASRMESTGKAFYIHISKQTFTALSDSNLGYHVVQRGDIDVKGKGMLSTYFLHGKDGFTKPLPKTDLKCTRTEDVADSIGSGRDNTGEDASDYDALKEGSAYEPSTMSSLHRFA
ncbi:atrial natriuretic peptide receptor 1-like [Glandiceps talaboti]